MELEKRIKYLKIIRKIITDNEEAILSALNKDLGKCPFEGVVSETSFVLHELDYILKNLKKWAKPKRVKTPLAHFPSTSFIEYRPYGKVLIISPWNYPFQLVVSPMIGAISAGNSVVVKPSEVSQNTSSIINTLFSTPELREVVRVVEGGVPETTELLRQKFDYIFYTGNSHVGKIVMKAASEYLTPVTLELGGKSPCIVDSECDLKIAAERIIWGKTLNSGQTCIAPDYVIVHESVKLKLLEYCKNAINKFYGETIIDSFDYGRIVNENHFDRIINYLENQKVLIGGKFDKQSLFIEPTLIEGDLASKSMSEEIFGPVLPIFTFSKLDEVFDITGKLKNPLAVYVFSKNKQLQKKVLNSIPSGGACVNDTLIHISNLNLPFGGVGQSGIGRYHGKESFFTFSSSRSVMKRSFLFDNSIKYPPYKGKIGLIKKLLQYLG